MHCALCIKSNARAFILEPRLLFVIEVGGEALEDHSVVVVHLLYLLLGEHRHVDEAGVVGEERQSLKLQEVAKVLGLLALNHQQDILGANAILASLVESWLIASYHAWLKSHRIEASAYAVRPLMAAQEVPHAVACAMPIGHRLLP